MEYYDKPPFSEKDQLGTGGCYGYGMAVVVTILAIIGCIILWRHGL